MTPTSSTDSVLPDPDPSRPARSSVLMRTGGVVAAMAAVGLVAGACSSDDSESTGSTTTAGSSTATIVDDAASAQYKNGEYTAEGGYNSPGGPQQVGVTVTLSNDVITAVSVDTSQTKGPSLEYQGKFAGGISDVVVGKNINDIDVDKVSGSSLTSGGFNEAIEKIKQEAIN
ncbi:FMN-binding protein [Gordonia westfalica]|uniref:FMN-binding domain-containing protein n=1 Tax=Gordonia westfalica TaxID=158898 RepID=A0A1H2JPA6_9ACTN|nr:FMN-binding protein [Gordonia westfalica]SDU58187.1 FMN-binding domain-containing protein [Gordonia westfalica]